MDTLQEADGHFQLLGRGTDPGPSDSEILGTWERSEQSIQCWTPTAAVQISLCDLGQAPVKCGRGWGDGWCHLELLTSCPHSGHSRRPLTATSNYRSFLWGHLLTGDRQKLYLASWLPEASGLARPTSEVSVRLKSCHDSFWNSKAAKSHTTIT